LLAIGADGELESTTISCFDVGRTHSRYDTTPSQNGEQNDYQYVDAGDNA